MTQAIEKENFELDLRFAHIDGHTELDFVPNKNAIITIGRDCDVRLWSLNPDDYGVQSSFPVEDFPYAVLATNDRAFVALESNAVKSFQLDELAGEDETMVCRFTSNATCLSFHPDHELLAAGAADFSIKLVNLVDQSTKILEGHQGPILTVAIDPLRKYLASSSCDGCVFIWNIETKKIEHKWHAVGRKSNDFNNSKTLCRICWEPQIGEFLAIPWESSVQLYRRGQWDVPSTVLKHSLLSELVSIVTISKDSQLLALSVGSIMAIWKFDQSFQQSKIVTTNPIAKIKNGGNRITCLKFNPKNRNQLCCTDDKGSLMILKIQDCKISNKSQSSTIVSKPAQIKPQTQAVGQKTMDDILADMDDADFDDIIDVPEKSKPVNPIVASSDRFGNLDDAPDIDISMNHDVPVSPTPDMEPDEFDISAIKSKYEPIIFGDDDNLKQKNDAESHSIRAGKLNVDSELIIDGYRITGSDLVQLSRNARSYQAPIRQAPFQSGSTPLHFQNRFMVWNSVGIVYAYNSDEERSIDVEFHDITFHHTIHMANMLNYTIADLSTTCLLLASNGDDQEDAADPLDNQKARMYCMLFNTWDEMKEWQVTLPHEEQFDCITAGQSFVAALTNHRYLRIWTTGGVQTMIRCIDGPSVNLSSFDNYLMVLYHQASQHAQDGQSISCIVLKVDHRHRTRAHLIPQPVPVALSPKSTVYWAGFTDEGTPCVVDSDGIVRVYKNHFGSGWFPICATKQQANGKSDNFFIIGLSEIQSQIRCIYCKACRYPDTVPKPSLTILSLQIPLCELGDDLTGSAKSKHEEECIRNRWLCSLLKRLSLDNYDVEDSLDQAEKQVINSLIKLFAIALGAERESLALEMAKLLPNSQALEGAVRYAERQRHRSLAMKLVEMIQEGDENDDADDDQNSDVELQELMSKKNAERLRQLLKDDNRHDSTNLISLTKIDQSNNSNYTSLKPKSLKNSTKNQERSVPLTIVSDDDNDDNGQNIEEEEDALRPKKLALPSNQKNPFKVQNHNRPKNNLNSNKRKQIEESDDDDDNVKNDKTKKITNFFTKISS
ncbi:chromosome transmission fidelity 4 [Dermatophagoides pteronyssinus]|uniref:WD repeat and HMG-box DNA binding-domain containing protein 1 n=2 Tax=Dermatophagoides pteronyssinus TaxID=6956 RepID=A0ABQ8JR88_DERPT|nr:WD repeat and HMG-box DNA binding-domain containing protein 1 [Dermatophagoides pteronyssinus]